MKEYFNSAIQYYLRHLSNNGCHDPVREVITDFTKYMNEYISEEQKQYINKNIKLNKDKRVINDVLLILKTIKVNNESDKKAISLIEDGLKSLL